MMTTPTPLTRWTQRQLQRLPPAYAAEAARHIARVLAAIESCQREGRPPPQLCDVLAVQEPPCPPQQARAA